MGLIKVPFCLPPPVTYYFLGQEGQNVAFSRLSVSGHWKKSGKGTKIGCACLILLFSLKGKGKASLSIHWKQKEINEPLNQLGLGERGVRRPVQNRKWTTPYKCFTLGGKNKLESLRVWQKRVFRCKYPPPLSRNGNNLLQFKKIN